MSKASEKAIQGLMRYLEEKNIDTENEEAMDAAIHQFIQEYNGNLQDEDREMTTYDYLEMAESTDDPEEALGYAQKVLEMDPDNIDARGLMVALTTQGPLEYKEAIEEEIAYATDLMKEQGHFDQDMGEFYMVFETRPYIRLRHNYMQFLYTVGLYKQALYEAEEILKLNTNDNMGARYTLMHLYAHFDMFDEALDLYERYPEDSCLFLMPLCLLAFKGDAYEEARRYLDELIDSNPDALQFFQAVEDGTLEDYEPEMEGMYRPRSMEELIMQMMEYGDTLYDSDIFTYWLHEQVLPEERNLA